MALVGDLSSETSSRGSTTLVAKDGNDAVAVVTPSDGIRGGQSLQAWKSLQRSANGLSICQPQRKLSDSA